MSEQLDIFGGQQDWEATTPKAQEKNSKPLQRQDKQEETDDLVMMWLRRFDTPLSADELSDRLRPVGLADGTVVASLKRLRHAERIKTAGREHLSCREHSTVGKSRWVPA